MPHTTLIGDIGGTNARFGLATGEMGEGSVAHAQKLNGDDHTHFADAVAAYLDTCDTLPDHALFAVAGPVSEGEVQLTHRDWRISTTELKERFGLSSVTLVNDFAAMARAVPELGEAHFETLLNGQPDPDAPILVAGPGTGLGMATLLPNGKSWHVLGGEGGHAAFAPRSDEDTAIADILRAEHGFVSYELVTSGKGLEPVHRAMCKLHGRDFVPLEPAIMLALAAKGDEICQLVCALRARAAMGFAGDMALANGARGGVVLAGGVSARLLPWLSQSDAQAYFLERGPRSDYMLPIPVRLMHGDFVALAGAAALLRDRARV